MAHFGVGGPDLVQTIVIQQSGAVSLVPRLLRRKIVLKQDYYMHVCSFEAMETISECLVSKC